MTNTPLSSNDLAKVLIFALLLVPTLLFFVGIIPAIFLAFGLFMLQKNADFSHIETAVKNVRRYIVIFIAIGAIGCLFNLCVYYIKCFANENGTCHDFFYEDSSALAFGFFLTAAVAVFYRVMVNKLFLAPLQRHRAWVEKNGIFSSKTSSLESNSESTGVSISRGEKLGSFSVADELLKWAKLKEDGHVTDAEYNEARRKLLQGNCIEAGISQHQGS